MLQHFKPLLRPAYFWSQSKLADYRHDSPPTAIEATSDTNHILVVCIDALRQDTVPELPGFEFDEGIAPSTWTVPSVTSALTGTMPHEHGAVAHTMPDDDSFAVPAQATPEQTLPGVFEAAGYETLGLFGFPMPFVATRGWFGTHRVWGAESATSVFQQYLDWRAGRERTFAYLQLADLHAPLTPPEEYVSDRGVDTSLESLASIRRYTDSYDGSDDCRYYRENRLRLYRSALDFLEDAFESVIEAVGENTLMLTFGDHGEAHWEQYETDRQFTDSRPNYGVGHGGTPLDMVARVPIGVNDSALLPRGGWASLVDLLPTLSTTVLDQPTGSGECWATPIPTDRAVLCEGVRYGPERKAVYQGGEKLLQSNADDLSLTARVLETGEAFVDGESNGLEEHLPEDWTARTGNSTGRLIEDQLEALGYN